MKNTEKDLEKLKNFSIAELMNGYTLILYAIENNNLVLNIDFNEALEDLKNELKTRSHYDLVEYIISTTK